MIEQSTLGEQEDLLPVLVAVLLDERAYRALALGLLLERRDLDLVVEVAGVRDDRAVLHRGEVRGADHVQVPGGGEEDVAALRGLGDRHHQVAVHRRLEPAQRVDLDDDHVRAHAAEPRCDAATDPAVARDDRGLSGDEDVGRAKQAVDRRLARAVLVVEHVLRACLIDRDDRVREHALSGHRAEPDDAGRGLFGPALHVDKQLLARCVEERHDVGAVIHRDLRLGLEDRLDVPVVGVAILALLGEDGDALILHERGSGIVLGGERVRGTEHDRRARVAERDREVRGLGRHMEARADPQALERLLLRDPLADLGQDGHLATRPLDAA